jgi:hypothetical protein
VRPGLNAVEIARRLRDRKGQQRAMPTTPSDRISSASPLAIRSSIWVAS